MTETMGGVVYDGLALNGVEVRIEGAGADEEGREGTIQLRTPTLMRGYRHPEPGDRRSPAAAASPIDEHGWFTTGDLGTIRPGDRHLEVRGRADDLIITGGEKVWPAPVEQRILEHPAVAEVAVYGRTDPEWGQAVTALLVPGAGAAAPSTAEIREWVSEKLPALRVPERSAWWARFHARPWARSSARGWWRSTPTIPEDRACYRVGDGVQSLRPVRSGPARQPAVGSAGSSAGDGQ